LNSISSLSLWLIISGKVSRIAFKVSNDMMGKNELLVHVTRSSLNASTIIASNYSITIWSANRLAEIGGNLFLHLYLFRRLSTKSTGPQCSQRWMNSLMELEFKTFSKPQQNARDSSPIKPLSDLWNSFPYGLNWRIRKSRGPAILITQDNLCHSRLVPLLSVNTGIRCSW
jgi:hypothetical protein